MKKELSLYGLLFVITGAVALWAAMPEKQKPSARTAVVSLEPTEITTIEYVSPEIKVTIKPTTTRRWQIETTKASDTVQTFLASARFDETLALLKPLEAERTLGVVKDEQLTEYGIKDSKKSFIVRGKDGKTLLQLLIGKQAFGSKNTFVQDATTKSVLLIPGDLLGDLDAPEARLFERTFTNVIFADLKGATIQQNDVTKKLIRSKKGDKGDFVWTQETTDGAQIPAALSWFERLERVRIVSFVDTKTSAELDTDPGIFQVSLEGDDGKNDTLKFVKRTAVEPAQALARGETSKLDYYVYSNFLKTWAKLVPGRMESIEADLKNVLK